MKKYKPLLIQAFNFFCISGIGWLIDMSIYTILTSFTQTNTIVANIISSIVSVTYVYVISTRKTFINASTNINLKKKYMFYIIYQICMILFSSTMIGKIANIFSNVSIEFLAKNSKIMAKIIFTPITMIANFIFMKLLIEKLK